MAESESILNGIIFVFSSVKMRNSLEQHPTNGKTLDWFEKLHTKGKLAEERLKYEAQVFFKKD